MNSLTDTVRRLIHSWIVMRVDSAASTWINEKSSVIATGDKKSLYLAFGLVPRKVGKSDLSLTPADLAQAESARPGWSPSNWSLDQLVRTYFVLCFPADDAFVYLKTLDQLFQTGEVGELVALYQALPLLPNPESFALRTAEGIRSNIKPVFLAVAYRNPYPSEHLNEEQWNQMILKCLFIGESVAPVIGIDDRANAKLMPILVDFAHERRAAHRDIPPELWRCVGSFADERALDDLRLVLTTGSLPEQRAAALALSQCSTPRAKTILDECPGFARDIEVGNLSWNTLFT